MARVGRLAGAILAETDGEYYLVGNTKTPCDWRAAGFEPPTDVDATERPFVKLSRCGDPTLGSPWLALDVEGAALARALAARFVIERNGSVSDRLWRLVVHGGDPDADDPPEGEVDARWLGMIPAPVWQVVRDAVLRCL
ncbi:MAG: precorrin-3B C(17)-methyltransferase [Polyangiaceae bacterium]|jgi:hypothetical protein